MGEEVTHLGSGLMVAGRQMEFNCVLDVDLNNMDELIGAMKVRELEVEGK